MLHEGIEQGDWEDSRGTGDALIAMSECLDATALSCLRTKAAAFLDGEAQRTNDRASWGEEVWDSAIALIALCREHVPNKQRILEGARWLLDNYHRDNSNWYDEPWKTLWGLIAMHDAIVVAPELGSEFDPRPPIPMQQ